MKVLVTEAIDIDGPVNRVYDFVSDITRWPLWLSFVVSAEQPDHRPIDLHSEIHLCTHAGNKRRHETFEVTRYMRNAFLSLEGAYSTARRIDIRTQQRGRQTRVVVSVGYPVYGGAIGRLVDTALRRARFGSDLRESLARLRAAIESSLADVHSAGHVPEDDQALGEAGPMKPREAITA